MADLLMCEPTMLYNILNQEIKHSRLAETNYLYLLDVRSKREYNESHIITAQRMKKKDNDYVIPQSMDLECVKYCIVYDGKTNALDVNFEVREKDSDSEDDEVSYVMGSAVLCARILAEFTRHPVYILDGGYECFSAHYHFFRTQKIFSMPQLDSSQCHHSMAYHIFLSDCRQVQEASLQGTDISTEKKEDVSELDAFEPYPIEVVPGEVYLGTVKQACNPQMHKDLKIKAHVNVGLETTPYFQGDTCRLLQISVTDSPEEDLFSSFRHTSHFMDAHVERRSVILVFSTRGISRSCTVMLAYLMHRNRESLKRSWTPGPLPPPAYLTDDKTRPTGQRD
uniref:Serine/threonine/tyrosine interacting like 1 n=1 Tax=Monodelphis domestica TaxID=13616 RepID=A0A5F8HHZ0_MONDO